jgi:hydrogenase-4 component F
MALFLLLALPVIGAIVSALMPRERQRTIEYSAVGASVIECILALAIAASILRGETGPSSVLFATDALGAFFLLFSSAVGIAAAIHSVGHLREEAHKGIIGFRRIREYFVLFHLFFFAMYLASATSSPIIVWVAIEATTLATAFLITFYNKPSALEAGWKLLIVNTVGLLLGFLGTLLFLNAAAQAGISNAFVSWDMLYSLHGNLDPMLIKVAFIFVIVGYGTKVGLVPMHTWLPDAHSKAPVPISSLLSGLLLNVALIAILRFRSVTDTVVDPSFTQHLLIGFGVVSLIVAALIIFGQKNYKRMLAYSSIEHMGIMCIGFGIGGLATIAALFHMLYHALLKPILFFCAGNFFLKYSSTKIDEIRGALSVLPFSAIIFFAGLLAISGIPPSGIFFTKLSILAAGMTDYPYLMLIVIAALGIVLAGFLRGITQMLYGAAPLNDADGKPITKGEASYWTMFSIGFLAVIFVVTSIYIPAPLNDLIIGAASAIQ